MSQQIVWASGPYASSFVISWNNHDYSMDLCSITTIRKSTIASDPGKRSSTFWRPEQSKNTGQSLRKSNLLMSYM